MPGAGASATATGWVGQGAIAVEPSWLTRSSTMQVKQSKSGVVKGALRRASAALLRARARHARRARARARVMELEGAAEAKGAALIFSCCWGLLTSVP